MTSSQHVYEVRPRKDRRGFDLISDALPFGALWYGDPDAINYAKFYSRSHDAVIRVYDAAGRTLQTNAVQSSVFKHYRAGHGPGPGVKSKKPETVPLNSEEVVVPVVLTTTTKFDCAGTVKE
jgi:hypothetical protein